MRDRLCFDCGAHGVGVLTTHVRLADGHLRSVDYTMEDYMVHDAVWERAGMGPKGFLHLRCLEKRLGRRLVLEDFTDAVVNGSVRFAHAMGKRAGVVEYGADLGRQILEIANTTGLEPVNMEEA